MNFAHSSSLQLVISDFNEIAADAYRHRIRSTAKKGGNGVYDGSKGGYTYALPERFASNRRAVFEVVTLDADALELRASSLTDSSTFVTGRVDSRGRLGQIRCSAIADHSDRRSEGSQSPSYSTLLSRPSLMFDDV